MERDDESKRFEDLYAELEDTVRRLESGELGLDEAIALFERGMQLVRACNAQLDHAELRVRQLVQTADGVPELVPLDSDASDR